MKIQCFHGSVLGASIGILSTCTLYNVMYIVQCNVHCTMYTIYIVQCTLYIVQLI